MSLAEIYLNDALTITPKGALQGDGTYAAGTPVVTVGRVVDLTSQIRTLDGRQFIYNRIAYVNQDETIAVGDTVTFSSVVHEVVAVYRVDDLNNTSDHIKAFLVMK